MIHLHTYGLAFLQLTFIIVSLMLLHSLKPLIGNIPFYLSLGATLVFAQFVTAAGMSISHGYPGLNVSIGPTIYFTPIMAALLIIYIVDGTTEAQRMILGIMAMVAIFIYCSVLAEKQVTIPGVDLLPTVPKSFIGPLFRSGRHMILATLLSVLIAFLVLPVVYQILRNRNIGLTVSVFAALIFTEVLDAFFYELVTNYPTDDWWEALRNTYLVRAIAMVWLGILTTLYLHLRDIPQEEQTDSRSALDILMAFLGSYGRSKRLQANVREWEGRYRMVVENTNDLILLVGKSGMILDANRVAADVLGFSIKELATMKIDKIIRPDENTDADWEVIWATLFPAHATGPDENGQSITGREWAINTKRKKSRIFDTTITPLRIQQSEATLVVARDVTTRKELEQERETLQSQLIHTQRMDAVGKLAGGIAHDYNNLLHAMQGSLDMLDTLSENRKTKNIVANINTAVNRASTLTDQLLGFARGGKYKVEQIDIGDLLKQTETLFRPMLGKKITLKTVVHPDSMMVEGDFTQLQQVLLNILINARAALEEEAGSIVLRCEPATEHTPGLQSDKIVAPMTESVPRENMGRAPATQFGLGLDMAPATETELIITRLNVEDFIVVRIKDNGPGMDEYTLEHIYDPFFTTKKSKGTGMGLAMAYGCVQNHHGRLHVETEIGKGTEFFVYLPRAR